MRLLALEVPDTQNDQGSEGTISVVFFSMFGNLTMQLHHIVTLHDRIILSS